MSAAAVDRIWLKLADDDPPRKELLAKALKRELAASRKDLDASRKEAADLRRCVVRMEVEAEAPRRRPPAALEGTTSRLDHIAIMEQKEAAERAERDAKRRRQAADTGRQAAEAETERVRRQVDDLKAALDGAIATESKLTASEAALRRRTAALEERLEHRAAEVTILADGRNSLRCEVEALGVKLAEVEASEERGVHERVRLEAAVQTLDGKLKSLRAKKRALEPLPAHKPLEQLETRAIRHRRQHARDGLAEWLKCGDLRAADIATALEETGRLDVVFDTAILWEKKMEFAQDLCDSFASVWDADLSVDMRDAYGLSERMMDGLRFDLSHETINGRPRRRVLVTNPHTKAKLHFPTPIKARCEWTVRMKEKEAAMELLEREGTDTCEVDFDRTFDDLVARDANLLRRGFTKERPLTACLSFDGADNFTHVTLRLCKYDVAAGVAEESELKTRQLAVAMGDDHYPRLEKVVAPRIGPAASARDSATIDGEKVPVEMVMCLDYSAARSSGGRRTGKAANCECDDLYLTPTLPDGCTPAEAFAIVDKFCVWLETAKQKQDAHVPSKFPFKCKRKGCKAPLIKDAEHLAALKAELAALKAVRTEAGKRKYAAAIAMHCDLHGQQIPYQDPVTTIPPCNLILDLLHGLDLNLPKVAMKYSILDPVLLTADMRTEIGDFLSEIGCALDVREKGERDRSRKWFHGSVWHYDFVKGANKKSYGLHVNIFQLCLIVYGVQQPAGAATSADASSPTAPPAKKARQAAPSALVDDMSDDDEDEDEAEATADLSSDVVMTELRAFFGANAEKVKSILSMWNAYADVYNSYCDEWEEDTDACCEERSFTALKAGIAFQERLNGVSRRRHKSWYGHAFATVGPQQMRRWRNLWRFSTRCVEGRGGRLKHIGKRMICWRRRGMYKRTVKAAGGGSRVITQSYDSAPERQLMRAARSREDRAHANARARVATTGRNTLARSFSKLEAELLPTLGRDALVPDFISKLAEAARTGERATDVWRI